MTDPDRERLRRLQDRLVARLRSIPAYRDRWQIPLWSSGPSPEQLADMLWPMWEPFIVELLLEEKL